MAQSSHKLHVRETASIAFIILFIISSLISPSFGAVYNSTYDFYVHGGFLSLLWEKHTLYISVTQSLYDYYRDEGYIVHSGSDYAKLVTPDAVKSIAEDIWSICRDKSYNQEEFANAVLMLVHQIPYKNSAPKYPVETIVDKSGDCDVLSLLAVSIMKAGGLDVVLLDYEKEEHMNVGVCLPNAPVYPKLLMTTVYYESDGKKYWMAECTSGGVALYDNWRVGERPDFLAGAKARIVSLTSIVWASPARISSRLDSSLSASSIDLLVSSSTIITGQSVAFSGSIIPSHNGQNIVIYSSCDYSAWSVFRTVITEYSGKYSFTQTLNSAGTYRFRASWSGDSDHAGADSEMCTTAVTTPEPPVTPKPVETPQPDDIGSGHILLEILLVMAFIGIGVALTFTFFFLARIPKQKTEGRNSSTKST